MSRINPNLRKPPPEPASGAPKRRGLRRVSKKRAALMRAVSDDRKAFVEAAGVCMFPDCNKPPDDIHEISRGHARERALSEPRLQMALCRKHHDWMDDYAKFPPAKQIALRIRYEIEETCRLYCEARGLANSAVTPGEVILRLLIRRKHKKK